jgi:hypothetical protein
MPVGLFDRDEAERHEIAQFAFGVAPTFVRRTA